MLASFVVPHAHYRVFHANPAADSLHGAPRDQFSSGLSPTVVENASTDLHLREFAQLEVQVKALQLQAAQHANPSAMGDAVAGALAECFLFYSRLFTVDSFPWPDFLAVVFTKMTEHFASSNNVLVQSAILRVFQQAQAHVAQVNDASKLLSHLSGHVTQTTNRMTRTLTLQLFATMPSLLVQDPTLVQQILQRLEAAEDHDERVAAMEVTRALLPVDVSFSFRNKVWLLLLQSSNSNSMENKSTTLCALLPATVSTPTEAQEAWTSCAQLYERFADEKSAITCLRVLTTLTAAYPDVLLTRHGQIVHHVLTHDPRPLVQHFTVLVTQQLIETSGSYEENQLADVMEGIFSRLKRGRMRLKLSALRLLAKWSIDHVLDAEAKALLHDVKTLLQFTTDERFGQTYTFVLMHLARHELRTMETLPHSVNDLLWLLHPRAAIATKTTWHHALNALARLCQEDTQRLTEYVIPRLVELLSISTENLDLKTVKRRRTAILNMLGAQRVLPSGNVIRNELPMLLDEVSRTDWTDASRLQALASTFFLWTHEMRFAALDQRTRDLLAAFERHLLKAEHYASLAERYDMATLAMRRGRFELAVQLLDNVVGTTDNECFGGWLNALQTLCQAESRIANEQWVQLDHLHAFVRVRMHFHAARTSRFRFEFQLQFLSLRLEWLQLVQSAQQLAGETAWTNAAEVATGRAGRVSTKLRVLARKFNDLRTWLLGASERDLDALRAHASSSELLAAAMEGFLIRRSPESMTFPTSWPSKCQETHWTFKTLEMLSDTVREKLHGISTLSRAHQPPVAARLLQQFIAALCGLPPVFPTLFFRSRVPTQRRLLASAQFLTHAETTAIPAKPRSRSQLGVSLGTDFTSVLKGVLAVQSSAKTYWKERMDALEVELFVCLAADCHAVCNMVTTNKNSSTSELFGQEKKTATWQYHSIVRLPMGSWDQMDDKVDDEKQRMLFVPFTTPVHVKASDLTVKGSFVLMAKLALVDFQGEKWPLAATGCRRGFIVY